MGYRKILVTAFFIILWTSFGAQADQNSIWSFLKAGQPVVIAHRGASSLAPENTLTAIRRALSLNVDIIEIDVHCSYDGELVVIHDGLVDRTTDGSGAVKNLTLQELQELDAGSWFRPSFAGERIPTLRAVLEEVRDQAILLIELKGEHTEERTVDLLREQNMTDQVIIQSFDSQQILKVKQKAPEIPTVILVRTPKHRSEPLKAAEWMASVVEDTGANGIAVRYKWYTPELVEMANQRRLAIFVWTVDTRKQMQSYLEKNVHGIITNRPQDLLKLMEE